MKLLGLFRIVIATPIGKTNTFECIDDTRFKHFINEVDFVTGSCPDGFCFTRVPANKNPCIGKKLAQELDNTISYFPEEDKANTFECIDDTQYKHFINNDNFVIESCPEGLCFTRVPANKNPCIGQELAQEIDGTFDKRHIFSNGLRKECINTTFFREFSSEDEFVIKRCVLNNCVTRDPDTQNPCIGEFLANKFDNRDRDIDLDDLVEELFDFFETPRLIPESKTNTFECIDEQRFNFFISENEAVVGDCGDDACITRFPPSKNPCVNSIIATLLGF